MNEPPAKVESRHGPGPLRRSLRRLCGVGLVGLLIVACFRFFASWFPWELFTHFQMHLLLAATALTAMAAVLRSARLTALGVLCIAVPALAIIPWHIAGPGAESSGGETLRIIHANIWAQNRRHDRVVDVVRAVDADVVILQEVNYRWLEALDALGDGYPHSVAVPRRDAFGMLLLSRLPIEEHAVLELSDADLPAIRATVLFGESRIRVYAVHPMRPTSRQGRILRDAYLDGIAADSAEDDVPVIIAGDFNAAMWSPAFRDFVSRTGLHNARRGFGVLPSWPVYAPSILRIPIDHCLVSGEWQVVSCEIGPETGSDHLPLVTEMRLAP